MDQLLIGLLVAVLLVLPVALAGAVATAPVSRRRLETFTARHELAVSLANGNQIIAYLATTRRWRAAGLAAGATFWLLWTIPRHSVGVNALTLLAGWFLGAVTAEVRVDHLAYGARRAAALARREPASYLPRGAWWLVPACAGIAVALAGASAVLAARGAVVEPAGAAWLAAALVVTVVVRVAQQRVLRRPQPLAAPDVLAADDAIRSRSMHSLAGGGAALILYCVLGQLHALTPALAGSAQDAVVVIELAFGYILVPVLGYAVATARWPVARTPSAEPTP